MPLPAYKSKQATASRQTACSVDTIILTTQAQIDNFTTTYPACTTPKYLIINGTGASPAISDLTGLSGVTQATKKLQISNTSVTSLSALNNLTYIGDTMQLDHNALLTSTGLTNITHLGALIFINLPVLQSIAGLSNQTDTIRGVIRMDSTGLTSLAGLGNINTILVDLSINYGHLTSFSGLTNLNTIQGGLNVFQDSSMTSLGLHNLKACNACLFWGMPYLTSLEDISHHLINKNISQFWMIDMNGLTDLSGLDSIHNVVSIYLWSNKKITSLHGLEQLRGDIYYGLSLHDFPLLTDISALSGTPDFQIILRELNVAITSVVSNSTDKFIFNPTPEGNGVFPIKNLFVNTLKTNYGWLAEKSTSIVRGVHPGPIDAIKKTSHGIFAVEWETGNIS